MEDYKIKFIEFLLRSGALKVGGDFILKSKRISPWFVNIGDFNEGESSSALGEFYADSILNSKENFDLLYGIPDTGKNFAEVCKKAEVDAVIIFPQSGPETERAWLYHALDKGLKIIVGGRMTHSAYTVSEGGFITDEGALEMYRIAARIGINNFVVPGNKPEIIEQIRGVVEAEGVDPIFYAPGFIAQGGNISEAAKAAGERFHGIVGRGIYQAVDKKAAAIEHTSQL